jgi:hypothetical protein
MITEASQRALQGLRDLTTIEWYVIPLLAVLFYIYTTEIKKARQTNNWDAVWAGAALFGADFVNETWNGWVFALSGHSACWTTPGKTALRTMVGWNIEIMFMFALVGIVYYQTIHQDKKVKILGIPNRWFWAIVYSAFCVFVEVLLNIGGHLVWEYPWWNRSFAGIWLIYLLGYFWFFVMAKFVIERETWQQKLLVTGILYGTALLMNVIGLGFLGWTY